MKHQIIQIALAALVGAGVMYLTLTTSLTAPIFKHPGIPVAHASEWQMPHMLQDQQQGDRWEHQRGHQRGQKWHQIAQRGPRGPRHHRWQDPSDCPMYNDGAYDASQLETIQGRVVQVGRMGPGQGIWLKIQPEPSGQTIELPQSSEPILDQEPDPSPTSDLLTVHLGPAWYLDEQEVAIVPDDTITITGIRSTWHDESTLIASEIEHGDRTVELRDERGYPLWTGE